MGQDLQGRTQSKVINDNTKVINTNTKMLNDNTKMISNTGPHGQPRHGTWHGTGEGDCVDCNIIIIIIVFTLSLYPPLLLVPKISGWSLYATIHLDIGMICSAPNNTSAHLLLLALFSSWSYHPTCFPLQLMRGHRLMSSKGPTLI